MYQEEREQEQQYAKKHEKLKLESLTLNSDLNLSNAVTNDDEFFDALCSPISSCSSFHSGNSLNSNNSLQLCLNGICDTECKCAKHKQKISCKSSSSSSLSPSVKHVSQMQSKIAGTKLRRATILPRAEHGFALWAMIKNCMGKDLTKIPLPVYFNEPLSTLQRLTEEYEYAYLLDRAKQCENSCEQLAYIAAFVISSYSSSSKRTGKPFNPLLGETFECDRMDDLGWRCISEQVSHHPPILAQYCEGSGWVVWQEFSMVTKLKGTSLLVNPIGINHLEFKDSGYHYTWNKINTTVHNLIVGTLWLDHHGELQVKNHTTGDECTVEFSQYKYFSSETYRKVSGVVKDKNQTPKFVLSGVWDDKIEISEVISMDELQNMKTENERTIWKRIPPEVEDGKYYNMTMLACQLNEPEEGVAPTDSRLRPDQRLMENGLWEEANHVKMQLEEKQRKKRKAFLAAAEKPTQNGELYGFKPVWFELQTDPITNDPIHMYKGEYWNCKATQDWSKCPDIFL